MSEKKTINIEKLQYIIDCMPLEELLCQLAEEASELAQAALKLRRTMDCCNPTPVPNKKARKNLLEEVSDVCLLLNMIGIPADINDSDCMNIMVRKVERWANRLEWEDALYDL